LSNPGYRRAAAPLIGAARAQPGGTGFGKASLVGQRAGHHLAHPGEDHSPFGPRGQSFHAGIDIGSPSYQEVKAAMDGEVILARQTQTGYGKVVILRHDLGFSTIYGHLNVVIAREGETVRLGQSIGGVGSTGRSTGPHLHFELRHDSRPLNPLPLLRRRLRIFWKKPGKNYKMVSDGRFRIYGF